MYDYIWLKKYLLVLMNKLSIDIIVFDLTEKFVFTKTVIKF